MLKFFFMLLFFSCTNNSLEKISNIKKAEKIYHDTCSMCHGEKGTGDGILSLILQPRPKNFGLPKEKWLNNKSIDGVLKTLVTIPHTNYYINKKIIDAYSKDIKNNLPVQEELILLAQYTLYLASTREALQKGLKND